MNQIPFKTKSVNLQRPKDAKYVVLTGATGLVGQYLVKDLLMAGANLAIIARSSRKLSAETRVEAILQRWEQELGCELPRPVVISGDLKQPHLGVCTADIQWISKNCSSFLHNAAIVQFEVDERTNEPWTSNCLGTQHALELAKSCGIDDFHYVSTAYVCGTREGRVLETELACGQTFRNAYEQSKFAAEQMVRERMPNATVYRPTIIAGDSENGFTVSYHGLMWYLRLFDILVPQQPKNAEGKYHTKIDLPVEGDEPHNVVTVDFVAKAIAELFCNPDARGLTFHLASDHPTTYRQVIEYCYRIFNSEGVSFQANATQTEVNDFAATIFEQSKSYHSYAVCQTLFDTSNLITSLPNLACPKIDECMVQRFIEFGRLDRWGKRRAPSPNIPDHFKEEFLDFVTRCFSDVKTPVAFDIVGPGGFQVTWAVDVDGLGCLQRGLLAKSNSIIRLSTTQPLSKDILSSNSHFEALRSDLFKVVPMTLPAESIN